MKRGSPDSPPAARVASAASSSAREKLVIASADADSALITPTKAANDGQQQQFKKERKRLHTQLQLAIEKDGAMSSRVVLTNKHKKKKSSSSAESTPPLSPDGGREAVKSSQASIKWPPVSSAKSLPSLTGRVSDLLKAESRSSRKKPTPRDTIEFEVNQECTSIGLVPSGRIAVAGFTDGTLRLFDLTGTFIKDKNDPSNYQRNKTAKETNGLFDDDASSCSEASFGSDDSTDRANHANSKSVNSHSNQRYGAVACQIHARGVHTSLLMDVAVSEDGLYAFGGVQRGSVELAAVYLGDVESYLDEREEMIKEQDNNKKNDTEVEIPGLLDLIQVDRHADAKLKGFGACTRLWNGWERATKSGERPEYLLFTGKGIKNIHIWSYRPSRIEKDEDSTWICLYDTPGNGTSIHQLYFRHNVHGTLQGISKSDNQKLRVWDLTFEQTRIAKGNSSDDSDVKSDRPKRPDYVDVASTEGTIGVCGPYAFASGWLGGMDDIINVVDLDADDVSSPYNCTQLALPSLDVGGELIIGASGRATRSGRQQRGEPEQLASARSSRTGRQQRGDLKNVVNVAGFVFDASHALLQLSDGSVVHYLQHDRTGHPSLLPSPPSLYNTCIDNDTSSGLTHQNNKRMSLARVGSHGMALLAVSCFNENTSRGAIMLRALPGSAAVPTHENAKIVGRSRKYWGFNGLKKRRNKQTSVSVLKSTTNNSTVVPSDGTPVPVVKNSEERNSVSPTEPDTMLDNFSCLSTEDPIEQREIPASVKLLRLGQMDSRQRVEPMPVHAMKSKEHLSASSKSYPKASGEGLVSAQMASQLVEFAGGPTATKSMKHLRYSPEPTTIAKMPNPPSKKHSVEEGVASQLQFTPVRVTKSTRGTPNRFKPNMKLDNSSRTKQNIESLPEPTLLPTHKSKEVTPGGEMQTTSPEPIGEANNSGRHDKKSVLEQSPKSAQIRSMPAPANEGSRKTNSIKVTPGDLTSDLPSEPATTKGNKSGCTSKEYRSEEGQMDSQLESLVRGFNQESIHSPQRSDTVNVQLNCYKNGSPSKKQKTSEVRQYVEVQETAAPRNTPPGSPKRRVRKKSPSKPCPDVSPVKDSPPEPEADNEPINNDRQVGFTGMTLVEAKRRFETSLPESCYQPRMRSPLLVEQLPNSTLSSRLASTRMIAPNPFPSAAATKPTPMESVLKRHCDERQFLLSKHRAEHEMVRKKVLYSIRHVVSTWDVELDSTRPYSSIVDSAKRWFENAMMDHQELLDDMIDRQVLEAESLMSRQTAELPSERAPMLKVSFPFPEVFEQARKEMRSMVK